MEIKLYDSELKIMEVLWKEGDLPAGKIAKILNEQIGWNRNTTYTVIKKCIAKGAVERYSPNFMCKALVSKKEVQNYEVEELVDKIFDGSKMNLFASFLDSQSLTKEEIQKLRKLIDKME